MDTSTEIGLRVAALAGLVVAAFLVLDSPLLLVVTVLLAIYEGYRITKLLRK